MRTILNPISRIAFALGAIACVFAALRWIKVAKATERQAHDRLQNAAWPTAFAMIAFAVGIAAMMLLGPWAKPYKPDAAIEAPFETDGDRSPDVR